MARFWVRLLLVFAGFGSLHAKPEGFVCKSGDARPPVQNSKGQWVIQSGGDSIVHWDSFSIDAKELVHFQQGGRDSAILNRVIGNSKSQILGLLSSNGKVFLLNPNGVLIGPNGRIETAGFIAASFDVMDEEFLSQKEMLFTGRGKEAVVNLGTIKCQTGDVALIAYQVRNEGSIEAPNGVVSLASGMEILLKPEGTQRVFIRTGCAEDSVEHTGSIQAMVAELRSASPYIKAIRSTGSIEACAVREEGGRIYLVGEKGTVAVEGSKFKGKTVHVLGEEIHIIKSEIDVSGEKGGTILVGGDYQGKDAVAKRVFVDKECVFNADALTNGNGGKVICWADDQMAHFGKVNARGGSEGGDGGLVEISGAKQLIFEGLVNTLAPNGKAGTLLLDPTTITIGAGVDTGGTYNAATGTWKFIVATNNVISPANLVAQLDLTNVTVITPDPTNDVADSSITVSGAVTWNAPTTLTLVAPVISITAAITNNTGGSGLTLTGNGNGAPNTLAVGVTVGANLTFPLGTIQFQNCVGGTATAGGNHGVLINSGVIVNGYNIIATDCFGGPGSSTDIGFFLNGGTLGSTTTNEISISGGSLGLGSNEYGIEIAGTVQVGNAGVITLTGTGGGIYNSVSGASTPTNNFGVNLNGATLTAGNGASTPAMIYITGTGGTTAGNIGENYGVNVSTSLSVNINSTYPSSGLNFVNCTGGVGGIITASNYGINFGASLTMVNGTLNFQNITGGSGGNTPITSHHGVYIPVGSTVTAPAIIALDCMGGPGISGDVGFYVAGSLGSASASQIYITGGTLGIGSSENGIQIGSTSLANIATVQVGSGGTISLTGTGGGIYNTEVGGSNIGVYLSGASLIAGNGSSFPVTINITGIGGTGSGVNHGVLMDTALTVNLNSTNSVASSLNFKNCIAGPGNSPGQSCIGVNFLTSLNMVSGNLNFDNCVAGNNTAGATANAGVQIGNSAATTVSAPTIIATNIQGVPNTNTTTPSSGMSIFGTLGTSATNVIYIAAECLGAGISQVGISSNGTIQVGDGGTITLIGTGGGIYSGTSSGCIGVGLGGTVIAGNGGTAATTITITGIGGGAVAGTGSNAGVNCSASFSLNNTSPYSSLNFINCVGGIGGANNHGVMILRFNYSFERHVEF